MLYQLWDQYRTWIVIAGISIFIAVSFWLYPGATEYGPAPPFQTPVYASDHAEVKKDDSQPSEQNTEESKPPLTKQQFVDLKGAVKQPGVYSFSPNDRINDLLQKAGGLLPTADQNRINLAQTLVDGMMVWIPAKSDKASPSSLPAANVPASITVDSQPDLAQPPQKVNINTATQETLMTLSGIGETRAKAIISYRQKQSGFQSTEQLQEIEGIGEKLFVKIKDKVTVH